MTQGNTSRTPFYDYQAFVLFIIAIAAAEVSLGLALIVYLYHRTGSLDPRDDTVQG